MNNSKKLVDLFEQQIHEAASIFENIRGSVRQGFVGRERIVDLLLVGFLSGLHVLIEDVPGVGKTTMAKSLAASVNLDFARIQFTPDLLPGDITGVTVWDQTERAFVYKEGAIVHQFILADEINRASPRTQSSLLEAMQEETVSVDGRSYPLPQPFFVIATQNPTEFVGAFPLPEGELDRFGLSFSVGYPGREEGRKILDIMRRQDPMWTLEAVASPDDLIDIRRMVRGIYIEAKVQDFILEIVERTRSNPHVRLGASPRASQHLQLAAQARALMNRRGFVVPGDVLAVAGPVLAHRLVLATDARLSHKSSQEVLELILRNSAIPVGIKI
jgi:MoxR-like ATPase